MTHWKKNICLLVSILSIHSLALAGGFYPQGLTYDKNVRVFTTGSVGSEHFKVDAVRHSEYFPIMTLDDNGNISETQMVQVELSLNNPPAASDFAEVEVTDVGLPSIILFTFKELHIDDQQNVSRSSIKIAAAQVGSILMLDGFSSEPLSTSTVKVVNDTGSALHVAFPVSFGGTHQCLEIQDGESNYFPLGFGAQVVATCNPS